MFCGVGLWWAIPPNKIHGSCWNTVPSLNRLHSEIDQIHLSIEAQCGTARLPIDDCHTRYVCLSVLGSRSNYEVVHMLRLIWSYFIVFWQLSLLQSVGHTLRKMDFGTNLAGSDNFWVSTPWTLSRPSNCRTTMILVWISVSDGKTGQCRVSEKPPLWPLLLAGGLPSTSSCFIFSLLSYY